MIRQDQNQNQNTTQTGRSKEWVEYVPAALALYNYVANPGGSPKQTGTQTSTQQTLPNWAIPAAQDTLNFGQYYTQNPNYRPSTLDRDYSGVRGYNAQGQPNSQVGGFGLNPRPVQPMPVIPPDSQGSGSQTIPQINWVLNQTEFTRFGPDDPWVNPDTWWQHRPEFQPGGKYFDKIQVDNNGKLEYVPFNAGDYTKRSGVTTPNPVQPMPVSVPDNLGQIPTRGRNSARRTASSYSDGYGSGDYTYSDQSTEDYYGSDTYDGSFSDPSSYSNGYDEYDSGYDITSPPAVDGGLEFSSNDSWVWGSGDDGDSSNTSSSDSSSSTTTGTGTTTTTQETTQPAYFFDPSQITPFPAYDRQRFANPSDRTSQGEQLLADRINEANPYLGAQNVADRVANYQSGYTPAALNLNGPQANFYNNVLSGFGNVNQGLRSVGYSNANQGLLGANDYTTGRSFQDRVQDFMNPYTDQVVSSSLRDINRARQMADLSTMGGAAKSGAFGGSREALMRAENTRNALDQAARTSGELRSAGFNTAANLAQQEELQRLGLTASDRQNLRGYQSAGNLQGQSLTAADLQNVRGLQSQGALAAQGLQAQGALTAQGLGAQSDRDVMNYQQQLQRQGNQIAADQARLAEQFRQSAGALNLQGAGALGNLTKMGVDDRRQRIADLLASGGAQDARNQQDLDFIFSEFQRELGYPAEQINLRNAAISPATGSIVTTSSPLYGQDPLMQALGIGLTGYSLLNDDDRNRRV